MTSKGDHVSLLRYPDGFMYEAIELKSLEKVEDIFWDTVAAEMEEVQEFILMMLDPFYGEELENDP